MTLVSMKLDPKEATDNAPSEVSADRPEYPYGLELRLDHNALAKLGVEQPPAVGSEMIITAKVVVTSASSHQMQGGEAEMHSCWQITDMEVTSASGERDAAATLYG